jgi:hypothetical protein
MNSTLFLIGAIFLGLLTLFSGFKFKQLTGSDYKNSRLRDRHGEGSFFTTVANFFSKIFWGIITPISLIGFIFCLMGLLSGSDSGKDSGKNDLTPKYTNKDSNKDSNKNSNKESNKNLFPESLRDDSKEKNIEVDKKIDKTEKEEYQGNDPIVRQRLGLPPLVTQEQSDQNK